MKVLAIDFKSKFDSSTSRLKDALVTVDSTGINLSIPIYVEGPDSPIQVAQLREYQFAWNDILDKAEDHGFILISAENSAIPEFTIEQTITSTSSSKINPRVYKSENLRFALILTPSKLSQPDDLTVCFWDDGQIDLSNITLDGVVVPGERIRAADSIEFTAPEIAEAGQPVEILVSYPVPNTTIYLETTAGTLNRSRMNSAGTVLLNTEGLNPGDSIKVKAGYKYWSGDAEAIIQLT